MIHGALEVAKYALQYIGMRFPRIMHVKTSLLNRTRAVRTCEHQVLKCSRNAVIIRGVGDWGTRGNVLALGEKEASMCALHRNTEEKMQVTEVLE